MPVKAKLRRYEKKLGRFEEQYEMDTEEFIQKFESGELGDDEEWFNWKFVYEAHQRLMERKKQLDKAV